MNLQDFNRWAKAWLEKDNAELKSAGIDDKDFYKVRTFLKEIVNLCKMITTNSQKNDKMFIQIQTYLDHLAKRKLSFKELTKPDISSVQVAGGTVTTAAVVK